MEESTFERMTKDICFDAKEARMKANEIGYEQDVENLKNIFVRISKAVSEGNFNCCVPCELMSEDIKELLMKKNYLVSFVMGDQRERIDSCYRISW